MSGEDTVAIRSRWNAADSARVCLAALSNFHVRNEAGGVCRASPREFLHAHVWCDKLAGGDLGHRCREGPPLHDLVVCILPDDNPRELYDRLRKKARR